jgi:isocitrate dehydrogenase
MTTSPRIVYTKTDEAPALATYSLLPILRRFVQAAGVEVELKDISLAGRILAQIGKAFPDRLTPDQRVPDALSELGDLCSRPGANVVKLPNISASVPQLNAAIAELQQAGYDIPDYPPNPATPDEEKARDAYARALGSAVNPVLREGNSDRRVADPVKAYARAHPHSMGDWSPTNTSRVASMKTGDFFSSERSHTCANATTVRIQHVAPDGRTTFLKDDLALEQGEVIDAAVLSVHALRDFLAEMMDVCKGKGNLFSIHLKATMMKVSDPIIFGHCVQVFFADAFDQHADTFHQLGVNPNLGLGDLLAKIKTLPQHQRDAIEADLQACRDQRPDLAMVDSDKGITNLHVPSDVIIDASMPAMIRSSGQMWGPDGQPRDTKCVIPDRSYAGVYRETFNFCREHGAFDPATMGSVANVGLMAKKAEEYGSHDKTFEIDADGEVVVVDTASGDAIFNHPVRKGDIYRMCQTKDIAVRDWVRLAVTRARAADTPAVFWLDENRPHDHALIHKVRQYLNDHDTQGLDLAILAPDEATRLTLQRCKDGLDTISVTGNVLRDYLTDLFPILELGTSAKMLSIVPLLAGGGLYETGAGGSAPKHVQQFVKESHLRWDSLGEFLALGVSIDDLGDKTDNPKLKRIADALNQATTRLLNEDKSPKRRVNELDNRGSHYYLALYWAQALAEPHDAAADDPHATALSLEFAPLAQALAENESTILDEINATQGHPADLGGYYLPDDAKAGAAMRPSPTLNRVIDG